MKAAVLPKPTRMVARMGSLSSVSAISSISSALFLGLVMT